MHDVGLVLKQVVDAFYDAPLAKHDFVPHGHDPVLHVSPQSMHGMYAPVKEVLKQSLLDVAPVSEDLSVEFLGKDRPYPLVPVIYIRACKTECYYLPTVIAQKM